MELGFDDYSKELLKRAGYTPESARAYTVKKLKKANLNEDDLKYLMGPIDQMGYSEVELILNLTLWYREEPEEFMKRTGKDMSDHNDYLSLCIMMDY